MRIYNRKQDTIFNSIVLYFTDEEIKKLNLELQRIVVDPNSSIQFMGTDSEGRLTKKLTVKIYDENKIGRF